MLFKLHSNYCSKGNGVSKGVSLINFMLMLFDCPAIPRMKILIFLALMFYVSTQRCKQCTLELRTLKATFRSNECLQLIMNKRLFLLSIKNPWRPLKYEQ